MKDKNKFTLKIVLVIALAVALIATLISCCVLATKGKLLTQASCDNNQTAFVNERPDLDCYATASSLETDYISISQVDFDTIYYGLYIPNNDKNSNVSVMIGGDSGMFSLLSKNDNSVLYSIAYFYGVDNGENTNSRKIKLYNNGGLFVSYLDVFGSFENEFIYLDGFKFRNYMPNYVKNMDIYVRTSALVSGNDVSKLQTQIDNLTAEKTALQKQVSDLTAEKSALQTQIAEKQNKINTLTAEKAALQKQVNDLTAEKSVLQTQVSEKQKQIDLLTSEKTALQKQVNDLTAKNTNLQNRLDALMKDTYFCKFETVVGGTYIRNGLPDIGFSNGANGVFSRTPFANGQKGKIHNTLYLDWDLIRPNGGLHEGEKVSFKNTFYIYGKKNETVIFNGLLDFVEYSIRNFDKDKGYPILMTGKEDTDSNITFRLVDYNADCMKDVVISDRTYKAGYDRGHANGISEATQSGHIFESSTSFLKSIFTDMGKLLDIKVFGNVTVGTLIGIPLILLVVMAVLKLVRG